MPESVQQIAGLIGFPATEALIRHFGGVPFRIGKGLRGAKERRIALLQEVLTPSQVALLMHHFGGEELYIALCDKAGRDGRNRCFLAELVTNPEGRLSTSNVIIVGAFLVSPLVVLGCAWSHQETDLTLGVYLGAWVTHGGVARFSAGRCARKQRDADDTATRTD
ncbi:MAG: hypothetical protein ACR5LG_07505 [Sodalis sp. (in: enterobacteria)]|uniref:hypothetical protein n=1 Tax=Sodalis sp. (in: enterobacteria) TaxID=1898979 RepID=UPI003F2A2326